MKKDIISLFLFFNKEESYSDVFFVVPLMTIVHCTTVVGSVLLLLLYLLHTVQLLNVQTFSSNDIDTKIFVKSTATKTSSRK